MHNGKIENYNFVHGLHRNLITGKWFPLHPHQLGRALTHDEMDYNLLYSQQTIAGWRIFGQNEDLTLNDNELGNHLIFWKISENDLDYQRYVSAGYVKDQYIWITPLFDCDDFVILSESSSKTSLDPCNNFTIQLVSTTDAIDACASFGITEEGSTLAIYATPVPTATATPEPTATEVPPTATPEPTATATPEPTATEVPPTATPEPTATEIPPTATLVPTATPTPTPTVNPTATPVPPTATPIPTPAPTYDLSSAAAVSQNGRWSLHVTDHDSGAVINPVIVDVTQEYNANGGTGSLYYKYFPIAANKKIKVHVEQHSGTLNPYPNFVVYNQSGSYTHDSIDNAATVVGWSPILTAFSDRSIPNYNTASGFIDNKLGTDVLPALNHPNEMVLTALNTPSESFIVGRPDGLGTFGNTTMLWINETGAGSGMMINLVSLPDGMTPPTTYEELGTPPTESTDPSVYYFHLGANQYPWGRDLINDQLFKADNTIAGNYGESFEDMLANPGSYEPVGELPELVNGTTFTMPASITANFYWIAIPVSAGIPDLTVTPTIEISGAPADICSDKLNFVRDNGEEYTLYKLNTVPTAGSIEIKYVN